MTTTVKTKGPLRVTNVLAGAPGTSARESIAQEIATPPVPIDGEEPVELPPQEGSFPIHNTLSVRIEGTGEVTVTATDYPAEIVAGKSTALVKAGATRTFDVKGTTIVRQAAAA